MHYLGERLLEEGRVQHAVSWFQKAGEKGVVRSMNRLGEIFREGRDPVTQDVSQSVFWYERAAEEGDREAVIKLAELYLKGEKTQKGIEKAVVWLERAAAHGHKGAIEKLERIRKENE